MVSQCITLGVFIGLFSVLRMTVGDQEIKFLSVKLKEGDKDMNWDESLLDSNSENFQDLAKKVRSKIGILFLNNTSLQGIKINAFWRSSVNANVTVTFKHVAKKSHDTTMAVINKTQWIDLSKGSPPKSYRASFVYLYSGGQKLDLLQTLVNKFKEIPGFLDIIMPKESAVAMDDVPMEIKILFDSRSIVNDEKLKAIIENCRGANGTVLFTNVTIKEEKLSSPSRPAKPTWLVILVALSCISILAGLIAFVYRVFKQSFLKAPKFKINEDQHGHRSRSSTETLSSPPQPHQNCVTPPVRAL